MGKSLLLTLKAALRSTAVHDAVVNDRAGEGDRDQAKLMVTPGTMWHTVANAEGEGSDQDLEMLEQWFPDAPCTKYSLAWHASNSNANECQALLESHRDVISDKGYQDLKRDGVFFRGPVGDNILHLCYLMQKYKLGRYLVKVFGSPLVNMPYQLRDRPDDVPSMYEGEVVLHMAIVNKQVEEVKFLLEHGAHVHIRAWGSFLAKNASCYYGEYPLSFAVAMEQTDIINMLIEDYGAEVDAQDTYGNTALHLAVIKSLPAMYELLADKHKARQDIPNEEGFTPLTLAAKENNEAMFQMIMDYQRTASWTYGPVTCYHIPLDDVDTVQSREDGDEGGQQRTIPALKIITDLGNAELLEMGFVKSVMEQKWNSFAKWIFYSQLLWYALLMASVSVLVALKRDAADGGLTFFHRAKVGCWFAELGLIGELSEEDCARMGATKQMRMEGKHPSISAMEYTCLALVLGAALLELYDGVQWVRAFVKQVRWLSMVKCSLRSTAGTPVVTIESPAKVDSKRNFLPRVTSLAPSQFNNSYGNGEEGEPLLSSHASHRFSDTFEYIKYVFGEMKRQGNPISLFLYAFIVIMLVHFGVWVRQRDDPAWEPWSDYTQDVELAMAVICGWVYVLYFTSGFKSTGPLVVMMVQMILRDFLKFMAIYLFIAVAFAQALYLLAQNEIIAEHTGMVSCNFCSVADALLSLFRFTLGDISYDVFTHQTATPALKFIFVSWGLVSNILMLNLLIALMNSTYTSVNEEGEQIWRRRWARIVLLMERRLPSFLQDLNRLGDPVVQTVDGKEVTRYVYVFIDAGSEFSQQHATKETTENRLKRIEEHLQQLLPHEKTHETRKEAEDHQNARKGLVMFGSAIAQTIEKQQAEKVKKAEATGAVVPVGKSGFLVAGAE